MSTQRPSVEPEKMLKTKGWKRDFSPIEPENILKTSQLQETVGTPKKHDKMPA
jgi:hypothetical protein